MGGSNAVMLPNRTSAVMLRTLSIWRSGMGPETSLRYPFTPHKSHLWALEHKTTYAPMIYTSLYIMIFDACRSITRASGRELGPENLDFVGPEWHLPMNSISKTRKTVTRLSEYDPGYLSQTAYLRFRFFFSTLDPDPH